MALKSLIACVLVGWNSALKDSNVCLRLTPPHPALRATFSPCGGEGTRERVPSPRLRGEGQGEGCHHSFKSSTSKHSHCSSRTRTLNDSGRPGSSGTSPLTIDS